MQPADLPNVPADVWQALAAMRGPWRTPVLASIAAGQGGDARTVVLRETNIAERRLVFFTDRRSRKAAQLAVNPGVCLLIFDHDAGRQLRLYGEATRMEDAALLDRWWAMLSDAQRGHYAADAAGAGLKEKGRENFAAFSVTVTRFHMLWLYPDGNEAAEFEWQGDRWAGRPVRP